MPVIRKLLSVKSQKSAVEKQNERITIYTMLFLFASGTQQRGLGAVTPKLVICPLKKAITSIILTAIFFYDMHR